MSNLSKEVLRNYIKEQNFTSPDEILAAMKDMFKDILQEILEVEMDTYLGHDLACTLWGQAPENNVKV